MLLYLFGTGPDLIDIAEAPFSAKEMKISVVRELGSAPTKPTVPFGKALASAAGSSRMDGDHFSFISKSLPPRFG